MMHFLPLSVRRKIRLMAWRRLSLRWNLASGITIELKSPADWEAYNEIFVEGEYDSAILNALNRETLGGGFAVLDLGSNFGFFCLRILHLAHARGANMAGWKFTMVEGSLRVLDELKQRESYGVLINHNADIIHGLAGSKTGSAVLYESDMHLFNSIVDKRGPGSSPVPFVDLELRFANCDRIDLMKCDIQGAEQQFLENHPALLRKTSIAVLELHHLLCNTDRCVELLKDSGFLKITTLRQNDAISVLRCER